MFSIEADLVFYFLLPSTDDGEVVYRGLFPSVGSVPDRCRDLRRLHSASRYFYPSEILREVNACQERLATIINRNYLTG